MSSTWNTLRDVAKGCVLFLLLTLAALALVIWGLSCFVKYIWWRWHE